MAAATAVIKHIQPAVALRVTEGRRRRVGGGGEEGKEQMEAECWSDSGIN